MLSSVCIWSGTDRSERKLRKGMATRLKRSVPRSASAHVGLDQCDGSAGLVQPGQLAAGDVEHARG